MAAVTLESIRRNGWICGVPSGVETPGLMTGLAGIGYGRCAWRNRSARLRSWRLSPRRDRTPGEENKAWWGQTELLVNQRGLVGSDRVIG